MPASVVVPARAAIGRYDAFATGLPENTPGAPVGSGHAGDHLVSGEVPDDPEHPRAAGAQRLQHSLARLADQQAMDTLVNDFKVSGRDEDVTRLKELRDESVDHEWLWAMGHPPASGTESDIFVTAVRLRLGANYAARGPVLPAMQWCS